MGASPKDFGSYKKPVPADVRRRVIAFSELHGRVEAERRLACSNNTMSELMSVGGTIRSDTLERVQKALIREGVR